MRLKKKYEWVYYTYTNWVGEVFLYRRKSTEDEKLTKYRQYMLMNDPPNWSRSPYAGAQGLVKITTIEAKRLFPELKI